MAQTRRKEREIGAEVRKLADLVQKQIDEGATTVEEIHKAIAGLPLDILERLDVFEDVVKDARKVQDASIGAVYDVIRRVNQEVGDYAKELLERRPGRRAPHEPAPRHARKKG
jgi:methyl-accepting chemotaxis protein